MIKRVERGATAATRSRSANAHTRTRMKGKPAGRDHTAVASLTLARCVSTVWYIFACYIGRKKISSTEIVSG